MIYIGNQVIREQKPFWNHCLFHPTDAVEDAWGKRILDRMASDGAIHTIRIYAMLEDIVYMDEEGALQYDFRVNDLRLDYLVEKGYDLIIAYAAVPDCIAKSTQFKRATAFNATRYKGKMWNTSPPKDPALWEEVCYRYTRHIVERYGIDRVSRWHLHCFNEPDIPSFFMSELPSGHEKERSEEYCKMYAAFVRALTRVSEKLTMGGPALANKPLFLDYFLQFVKENDLRLDYIALHNYGTGPKFLKDGTKPITVRNNLERHEGYMDIIRKNGFEKTEIIIDEWGIATQGFANRLICPELMFRETEVFSAYYGKLIRGLLDTGYDIGKLVICLSGQHEMTEDFSGFRNFFTLNFIAKPIYNAHILASRLGSGLLEATCEDENTFVIPTKTDTGYAVLLGCASEHFLEDIPYREETVTFREDITGKQVTVWCIDKAHTNPYRLFEAMGSPEEPTREQLAILREEGRLKPLQVYTAQGSALEPIPLTPNSLWFIQVETINN